ncbi:MAG: DUF2834 domain-containing protein [Deltaproteobacteria bacterium]|nr:DUF2834 domain-containing protein [Deltaproteobacteria bacterium]
MKVRIAIYAVIAVLALYFTWSNNLAFMSANPDAGITGFVDATTVNAAAASISWDLTFLLASCFIFMAVEARKHRVRFVWVYYLLSFLIAVAVMFPLFMIARELKMGAKDGSALG